jgi:hypothetical protein
MRKYITQMLDDINADTKAIENYKNDAALKIIFEYAFDPEKKMNLPEGAPPYKLSVEPLGMTPTNLFSELRRLYVFNRADLTPFRRESLFVSLLEGVHPTEADMLIAVKDQALSKLYPKITHKLVYESGFIAVAPVAKEKKVAAKKVVAPKTGAKV